ncbi:MAG: BspA family leucine-rich repeat surface protein [Mediterranea massiliensis]|nr:BspA family leucine-rich repeat surface protein [Mediterranea massiliensis]
MKTIFRLLCGWMAIALAACTGDELQQIEPLQKPVAQKTISVKAYTPSEQAATRLDFSEETDGSLSLAWSADDAFTAVIDGEEVTFTYNESSKEFTANVNESVTLTDGLKAYYPAYDGENFEMDFSQQTGQLNGATTYMKGVYSNGAFRFTHSTAILKAKFSDFPPNAVISSIQISGGVNVTISNPNASISKDSIYINLPVIPKDGQLKFMVETATGNVYTATKTVMVEEGIETGVYYNTSVELQEACLLPTGIEFNSAIRTVNSNENATSIVFEANVADETPATRSDSNYTIALADNVLTISTPLSEFVFNADCNSMFASLFAITAIDFNNCINTANVMFMDYMFSGCIALTSLDLSSFNTANVMSMDNMFYDCQKLTSLNLSSFNTANVVSMDNMFNKCFSLTSLNVSSFNTANVTSMSYMFNKCSSLESLDLSSFDFGKDANFSGMFTGLGIFAATEKSIPVYVTMAGYNVLSKKSIGIDNSSAQLVALCELLTGSSFNSAVNSFLNGKSLTKIKFIAKSPATTKSDTNDENATEDYSYRLVADSDNETLEIHTAAAEFVFNEDCSYMFTGLSTITAIDFYDCVNTSKVTNMSYMFNNCSSLTSLDLSNFNTSKVTNMNGMFRGCSSLESLDLSSFNTGNVTSMTYMFYYCSSLQSITFGNSFNTANVTDMSYMFSHCSAFTSLDLSSFNTANVTDMSYMFSHCSAFTSLDLSSFNTANVTNMTYMFRLCSALTSLNVSNFNTEKVTDMSNMFVGCYSLESLDLSSFDFGKVANFSGMFTDLGKNVSLPLVYIYVKDVNDKQKLDNANTYITKSRVIISVKQP